MMIPKYTDILIGNFKYIKNKSMFIQSKNMSFIKLNNLVINKIKTDIFKHLYEAKPSRFTYKTKT